MFNSSKQATEYKSRSVRQQNGYEKLEMNTNQKSSVKRNYGEKLQNQIKIQFRTRYDKEDLNRHKHFSAWMPHGHRGMA